MTVALAVFFIAMSINLYRPPIRKNVARLMRALFFLYIFTAPLHAQTNPHLYSTGSILELDRCASAWLIKRYVDKDADIRFFAEGGLYEESTNFSTPDSKMNSTHNQSAFTDSCGYTYA
ncbi:MAG: chromate resistance protein ChrB domain-containing protein [Planctomycetota bacterium]